MRRARSVAWNERDDRAIGIKVNDLWDRPKGKVNLSEQGQSEEKGNMRRYKIVPRFGEMRKTKRSCDSDDLVAAELRSGSVSCAHQLCCDVKRQIRAKQDRKKIGSVQMQL